MMRVKKLLGPVLLAGMLFACSEGIGPDADVDHALLSNTPNLVKWSADGAPSFSAEGDIATTGTFGTDQPLLALSASGGSTTSVWYKTYFWAVRGEHRYAQINYASASLSSFGSSNPFVRLDVYDPVTLPDGSALAVGDSVAITVYANPATMQVLLYPHGLTFGEESELSMWYGGANGDLNGDGVVDDYDLKIEYNMLGMWYQASWNDPWTILDAEQDFDADLLEADLEHFSGYGVAW